MERNKMLKMVYFYFPILNFFIMLYFKFKNTNKFNYNLFFILITYFVDIVFLEAYNSIIEIKSFLELNNIYLFLYCVIIFYLIRLNILNYKFKIKNFMIFLSILCVLSLSILKIQYFNGIFLLITCSYFLFKMFMIFFIAFKNFKLLI